MNLVHLKSGRRLSRLQRHSLLSEVNALLKAVTGKVDPYAGHEHESALRSALYATWQSQLHGAMNELNHIVTNPFVRATPDAIMHTLNFAFSKDRMATAAAMAARPALAATIALGKQSVDAQYKKQTGRDPVKKADVSFGILFGLTEDHAVQALVEQITIAAGGFWEGELSDSIRKEIESFFTGELTREELTAKLNVLVNTRLSIEAEASGTVAKSLPASYFDGLAEHYVVRARNVGSVYQAKSLGATHYKIVNPRDKRTSGVCMTLSKPGMVFHFAGAESKVEGILGARSQDELKAASPFLTEATAGSDQSPVPPLHWRCRSWIQYVFEGL